MDNALRVLRPEEIDAIERFVKRLREEGLIRPPAAQRWQVALELAPARRLRLRTLQG